MEIKKIENPRFLKQLNIDELNQLSQDIRDFLIENISKTGGHFSSNLGIVELTVALHYVFDSPEDKFLFDVGHQAYVHKILTGRAPMFTKLKKYGGMCGELGADLELTEEFLSMGLDELSVSPAMVLPLRKKIRESK